MRVLLTTLGSYGDLHPYMAIGLELSRRGHSVTIATHPLYADKVTSEGLLFHPVRPDLHLEADSKLMEEAMDAKSGTEWVLKLFSSVVRETYADTLDAAKGADAIVSHPITFASVLAAQKLNIPWISSVLAPISFLSEYDPPVPAQFPALVKARALGPGFMGLLWSLGKKKVLRWVRPVVELRRELGLPDSSNPLFEGSHSPRLVLALFSRYLTTPQPDWPPHTVVTGFPFFDRHHDQSQMPPDLERFLANGPAPVVFTLGSSAVAAAGDFYRESLKAVEHLGVRAVFLIGPKEQGLPAKLPSHVITASYVPHSEIFPRASAIVHQGGIGTTAQAIRSGRPMLVVPFAHDQFDNAALVNRLGVAQVIYRYRYNARRAEEKLKALASCESAAAKLGAKIRTENGTSAAADAIEQNLKD